MADDDHATLAIRSSRPFRSEDEFLEHELDTLTRTTLVVRGAPTRPKGVILRFELALASGSTLLRGEGRVLAYRPATDGAESALTIRFTRLDARSKALVDRAGSMREARARASYPPAAPVEAPPAPSPDAAAAPPSAPGPEPHTEPSIQDPPSSVTVVSSVGAPPSPPAPSPAPRPASPPPSGILPVAPASATIRRDGVAGGILGSGILPVAPASATTTSSPSKGLRRDELLDRLRQRAKTLSPSAVEHLLASRARR